MILAPSTRHAHYISLTLAERMQLKTAIEMHSGSIKAFARRESVIPYVTLVGILAGRSRVCPKKLKKLKAILEQNSEI